MAGNNISNKMPVLFVGHGSPMNALEDNIFSRAWRALGAKLSRPHAILCISAHWQTPGPQVTAMDAPPTIHDFGSFPQPLFDVRYAAPGSPQWAARITQLVAPGILPPATLAEPFAGALPCASDARHPITADHTWGLDHGSWSVLCHMFPEADIPVLQLSLDIAKTPAEHYQFAKVLAPLRDEGILIIGSGNIVHNLGQMIRRDEAYDWAMEIDQLVAQQIEAGNHAALIDYPRLHPKMLLAVPTAEHYLPLLYILALQEPIDSLGFFNETVTLGSMSMRGVQIG